MSFLIAAAGTGGHVFPGLAVGEALMGLGVPKDEIMFVGGDRMEADVYPRAGFPFLQVEMMGLRRSASIQNLTLPRLVWRARDVVARAMTERRVRVALAMGGYVTVPTGLAARKAHVRLMVAEQNAEAGLANRVASRWALRSFGSFPHTPGLSRGEWVGNPVRRVLSDFDRAALRPQARERYSLVPDHPVLGVFGGSLGAAALNEAVAVMCAQWEGPPIQVVHIAGPSHVDALVSRPASPAVTWARLGFEDRMDLFYAASHLVVGRAGGGVAELTATGTPSILVPGEFGSHGHQTANAAHLGNAGAAVVLAEAELGRLPEVVATTLLDPLALGKMGESSRRIGRPHAALAIATAMLEAAE
ncbi:MAG: UDP-N-acetylglucosamine--N-acetylmuramyl-(pentapeptide) pyrophosphoryl-undecaprenol N-acetylglucosamine transferase [Acidimicrobiia bacterium]